jgi:hypothetical protein
MANWVKNEKFTMGNRTFLILGVVYVREFGKQNFRDLYNPIEFIEIDPNVTFVDEITGRTRYKEIAPNPIAANTEEEKYYEEWRKMEGTNLRTREYLDGLLADGKIKY